MEESGSKTSIKGLFQTMGGNGQEIIQGIVKSTKPLKIQALNDEKFTIGQASLIVSRHLTDYKVKVDISGGSAGGSTGSGGDPSHSHGISSVSVSGATMTVHNALEEGDRVYMFAFCKGKRYFVLDKVV